MAGLRWRVLFKLPAPKRSSVLHGALATNTFANPPNVGEGCIFCNMPESVHYVFIECHHRVLLLLSLLCAVCGKTGVGFSEGLYKLAHVFPVIVIV